MTRHEHTYSQDLRSFSGILIDWVERLGNEKKFLESTALDRALTADDVLQLMAENKVPNPALANYLSALLPEEITTWPVIRNRGQKAVEIASRKGTGQIAFTEEKFHEARLVILQRIAQESGDLSLQKTHATPGKPVTLLGQALRFLRHTCGMTERDLEVKIGVTRTSITNYEAKGHIPKPRVMANIAKALNVNAAEQEIIDELISCAQPTPWVHRYKSPTGEKTVPPSR